MHVAIQRSRTRAKAGSFSGVFIVFNLLRQLRGAWLVNVFEEASRSAALKSQTYCEMIGKAVA